MFLSFIIDAAVLATFAKWGSLPKVNSDIGMDTAAEVFKDKFGSGAKYVWGIGLLASGLSSVLMVLITGPYIMEGFMRFNFN